MKTDNLYLAKKKADAEFKKYRAVGLKKLNLEQKLIMKIYNYLKKGKKVIDLQKTFEHAGINEKGEPKLAIARADWKKVLMKKESDRLFFMDKGWRDYGTNAIVLKNFKGVNPSIYRLEAPVPYIPPYIAVYDPKKFYILWEVEEWKPIQPRDPILLKKISENFYLIVNFWNLTEVERKIVQYAKSV